MVSEKDIMNPVYVLSHNNTTIELVTLLEIKYNTDTNLQEYVIYRDQDGKTKQIDSELCFEYHHEIVAYIKELRKIVKKNKPEKIKHKIMQHSTNISSDMYNFLKFVSDADWINLGKRNHRKELSKLLKRAKQELKIKE